LALENTAPDLPPKPGEYPAIARDYEYVRHGTVSLLAGIDLLTGNIYHKVFDNHRSKEFVEFLKYLDDVYPSKLKITIIVTTQLYDSLMGQTEGMKGIPTNAS
jgi:hypothetical protein